MLEQRFIRKIITITFAVVILVFCLRYLFLNFDWHEALTIVRRTDLLLFFGGGGIITLVFWWLRAMRLKVLLQQQSENVNFVDIYMFTAIALGFAVVTPIQSGEVIKLELLKKHVNLNRMVSYGFFTVEKVLDFLTVVVMGIISIWASLKDSKWQSYAYCCIVLIALLFITVIIFQKMKLHGRFKEFIDNIKACLKDKKTMMLVVSLTVLSWVAIVGLWMTCLHAVSLNISYLESMALMSMVTLVVFFSFIPGGVGVAEAGTAKFLMVFGYSEGSGLAAAVVLRVFMIFMVGMGFLHLVVWKFMTTSRQRTK